MIDILYTAFQTWLIVAIAAYCVWVFCGFKTYNYESVKHLYVKYGKYSEIVYCSEIIVGSMLTAAAWPLQLFVAIIEENK